LTRVRISDIASTQIDPLARLVRKRLRDKAWRKTFVRLDR